MTSDAAIPNPDTTVLRPSRSAYARAFRANLWIAIPLLVISLVRIGLNPWLLPVFVAAIAVSFGGVMLYFRRVRVEFGGGQTGSASGGRYRVENLFGWIRTFTSAEVGTLVTIISLNSGSITPPSPQLILTRPDGSKLLRLRGQTWEVGQFAILAEDLMAHGVVNDAITEPITTVQLRRRYPKVIGLWEAHPIASGLILGFGIVFLALVIVALLAIFASTLAG